MLGRRLGATEAQVQISLRLDRPDPVEADPELAAQGYRFRCVITAGRFAPLPGFQPGKARQRRTQLYPLTGLVRQPDRFVVAGLRGRPLVGRRLIAGKDVKQCRKDAHGDVGPGAFERSLYQCSARIGLA